MSSQCGVNHRSEVVTWAVSLAQLLSFAIMEGSVLCSFLTRAVTHIKCVNRSSSHMYEKCGGGVSVWFCWLHTVTSKAELSAKPGIMTSMLGDDSS